jgi:hypothetical protein
MSLDGSHWHKRAEELRGLAKESSDPEEKQLLLKLVADYERLAERAVKVVQKQV